MTHIEAAYLSAADRLQGIGVDEFARRVASMDVHPVDVDGRPAGAVIVCGNEVHACVLPEFKGRWFGRRMLVILRCVIEKHGKAITSATTEEGRRFVERLGFKQEGDDWVKHGN